MKSFRFFVLLLFLCQILKALLWPFLEFPPKSRFLAEIFIRIFLREFCCYDNNFFTRIKTWYYILKKKVFTPLVKVFYPLLSLRWAKVTFYGEKYFINPNLRVNFLKSKLLLRFLLYNLFGVSCDSDLFLSVKIWS